MVALEAGYSVAIYSTPHLLAEIRETYDRESGLSYAGLGRNRLDHLEACLDAIRDEAIAGHLV